MNSNRISSDNNIHRQPSTNLFTNTNDDADRSDIVDISLSGNKDIDSLLYPAKWADKQITFSFLTGNKYTYGSEDKIKPVTETMKGYLRNILGDLENIIDVDFVEVEDSGNNYGQIRYLFSDGPSTASTKTPYKNRNSPKAGDVHFNRSKVKDFEEGPGAYRYETLIHETLHTLDLKHPGNYNSSSNGNQSGPFLSFAKDNSNNSIMSYNRLRDTKNYSGTITPMPFDIRALQYLYGAANYNGGNTTYKFSKIDEYTVGGEFFGNKKSNSKQTIWDSGGTDIFDFSQLKSNNAGYRFDLREGGVITSQNAYLDTNYEARGDKSDKKYKATSRGTFLAYNTTFENLVNSSSDDYIIANEGANTFSGYRVDRSTGKDVIANSNSKDTLDLSAYKVSDFTTKANGKDLVVNLNNNSSVTIEDYYQVAESDRINILTSNTNPAPNPTPNPTPPNPSPNSITVKETEFLRNPDQYMKNIRDFGGTNLGASNSWKKIGAVDVQGDGDIEHIFVNSAIGRWATVGANVTGVIDFANHGEGGDTRAVGIYEDPLIKLGIVKKGSDFDSQKRFQNDLLINNLTLIEDSGSDYDRDGFQEIYFQLNDNTGFLRTVMHADGNIQYANYQSESDLQQFMNDNGIDKSNLSFVD